MAQGTQVTGTAAQVVLVQVQTMVCNQGTQAGFAAVQVAIAAHNKANPKAQHTAVLVPVLANNTKGMQFALALQATLARLHGATMVRLGVHGGAVALCGTAAQVKAAQAAHVQYLNAYGTQVANAYNPAQHGNKVGFVNAYLCGMPAGLQVAAKLQATLVYGLGYLYSFAAPTNTAAYVLGTKAAQAAHSTAAPKPRNNAPKGKTAQATPSVAQAAPQGTTAAPQPQAAQGTGTQAA